LSFHAGDKIWVSPGSGSTAYNFYVTTSQGDQIILGVYQDGSVWSVMKKLGEQSASSLSKALAGLGIDADASKEWCFWRKNNDYYYLETEDIEVLSEAIVSAIKHI